MEQETVKLLNVLRRIARAAAYASWTKAGPDAAQFLVAQYNRVLARLTEIEPAAKALFTPLSESASPQVIRIATRELLAYFEAASLKAFVLLLSAVAHAVRECDAYPSQ